MSNVNLQCKGTTFIFIPTSYLYAHIVNKHSRSLNYNNGIGLIPASNKRSLKKEGPLSCLSNV